MSNPSWLTKDEWTTLQQHVVEVAESGIDVTLVEVMYRRVLRKPALIAMAAIVIGCSPDADLDPRGESSDRRAYEGSVDVPLSQALSWYSLELPEEATGVRYKVSPNYNYLDLVFRAPCSSTEEFLISSNFSEPLRDGYLPPYLNRAVRAYGWDVGAREDIEGLEEAKNAPYRYVAISHRDGTCIFFFAGG